ncbi:hypothetical protein GOP47_0013021 [Adiantum capillus-veneris]|uniref:THO complex subunit 2 n=1 Tax=Adiantum capillus-veneris TaxID=13818 RepID=A0A9D4URT2_ADICA|nr:hypothetical protein GOP47_0013021 [Adiantum capillus-veneris]
MALERKYITEEHIHLWKTLSSAHSLHVEVPAARFIYELCWTVARGDLPLNKFRLAWESVSFTDTCLREESSSLLADTIAHMGQEFAVNGDFRSQLVDLAKWLVENDLLSLRLLQERCEAEFLWDAEMIKIKAPDLKAKEVRVNTRLLYQQTKFNLLREESEGYAKLVTLLSRRGPDGLIKQTAPAVISTIKSLIGHFDLDPNRVFDIVLECYELQPDNAAFLELIPLFPKSHTSHILGFKFQYYQRPEIEENVPSGLYILAATLIKANFIDLDSVFAHLLPNDEDAFLEYENFSKRHLDEANRIGKINLAATGKDLMEEEKPGDVTIDLFAALDMESEATLERSQELFSNQKLGLLHGFLLIDDWPHAHMLFERFANLNPVAHHQICDGLFRAIEKAIKCSYQRVRPSYLANLEASNTGRAVSNLGDAESRGITQTPPIVDLGKEFFQMLACTGPYLFRNALLLQKVCRVLRGYVLAALNNVSRQGSGTNQHTVDLSRKDARLHLKEVRVRTEEALGTCLLPSLQLLPANPAIGLEIWEVMSLLPYEMRYRLYGEWEMDDERIPLLVAARQTAKLDTRRILKRLAKENLKQLGRMVAKIAHANPMTVLRTIVHQIEAYKDMITPVVDAFKYLTQLEYDILEYVVIERLAQGGRDKLKEDGLNLSDWLQSLASFWGHLCKKYPSMELRGLFQYLVNKLKKGEGIELVVLQELIQQMANVEYTENVTEEQLEAMAGGETLRLHATSFGATKNNKALLKSTNRLRDALLPKDEPKLAVPLLLLIAQHRSKVVIDADAPHIKMVSEQFDRCHGTLLQYVEFLTNAVTPATAYAQLIPPLEDLLHKYHIEPEICFLLYRPILHLFKPFKGASISWPMDIGKGSSQSSAIKENSQIDSSNELSLDLGANKKPVMWSDLLATVHSIFPSKAWNSLSPELYITFWGLSLQDLFVPRKRYEAEIAKQHAALKLLEESSDNSHAAITKRKKDKEKIQEVLDRLSSEMQKQEQHAKSVHQRLVKEKDSWLTLCPDSLKINMEFLQRCIFPRCVLSMIDALYCARFVHTLHSLGTPFFNTVNHIDVLLCKTLQPMISSCTEYEAGRFGRFLCETLKMAYYWKSQESIYEKECGNMPGFAVLYRDPNSTRVTFTQFLRVHLKWGNWITKSLILCLESADYIEIRNALTVLTKISSVFPVTRKTGLNLEKRVIKIKGDEREDLKVLATGVAAALAARKGSWVSDEEFSMGLLDLKPTASSIKASAGTASVVPITQLDHNTGGHHSAADSGDHARAVPGGALSSDAPARGESISQVKAEISHLPVKSASSGSKDHHISLAQAAAIAAAEASKTGLPPVKHVDDRGASTGSVKAEENISKASLKFENEDRARRAQNTAASENIRATKVDVGKEETRLANSVATLGGSTFAERDTGSRAQENLRSRPAGTGPPPAVANGSAIPNSGANKSTVGEKKGPSSVSKVRARSEVASEATMEGKKAPAMKVSNEREADLVDTQDSPLTHSGHLPSKSPRKEDASISKSSDELTKAKRSNFSDEIDRTTKRKKNDGADRGSEAGEFRKGGETGELRSMDREKLQQDQRTAERSRSVEHDKSSYDERATYEKLSERMADRSRERASERADRDYRGDRSVDRLDRSRDDRFTRESSVDKVSGFDRPGERSREERVKDDRGRPRYNDQPAEQPHPDDRFPMQHLPPPPPLPPNLVPQSLSANRREDEDARRAARLPARTPHREEKSDKRRPEDGSSTPIEDIKRKIDDPKRKDDDVWDRKRDDREMVPMKADKERDRDKDDISAANSKRRRLKRDHISSEMPSNLGPSSAPPPPPLSVVTSDQYDRDRDRKSALTSMYEDPAYDKTLSSRVHKEPGKVARREHDQAYDHDWDEEKRSRNDMKRRHHRVRSARDS